MFLTSISSETSTCRKFLYNIYNYKPKKIVYYFNENL